MTTDKTSIPLFTKIRNNKKLSWVIKFTQAFVIALILILVFLDIILYSKDEETISELINQLAYGNWFVFSWIWGVLAAHMFFTRKTRAIKNETKAILSILGLTVLVYLSHFFINGDSIITQLVSLTLGVIAGYFIWPQLFDKSQEIEGVS